LFGRFDSRHEAVDRRQQAQTLSDEPGVHNMSTTNRREFLQRAACQAIGAASLATPFARAIEPIARQSGPHFKFSLAAYSYRDLLTKESAGFTLEDFVRICAELQLEGTELTSYYFPKQLTPEYLRHLKQQCFLLGLDVSGTAVGNDFCWPQGEKRDEQIAHVKQWVDHAEILGAPVIRIFSGKARPGQSTNDAHRLVVEAIEECCDYAGRHGVYLALENHGGLTDTVNGMLALIRDVKSPWFGVNLDTGNFTSDDVYGDLARIAPYAVNVQVKVSIRPARGKKQHADFSRLAQIIRDAGYRGYIVLEYEEPEPATAGVPKYMAELKEAFG
jgi:sugar phosphate isomerase/epimerase